MSKSKVRTVDSFSLSLASVTGRVPVEATGTVTSGGWTDAELIDTRHPPNDGNHHLDFVAESPDGIATQVILPISASRRTTQAVSGNFCVIIHAATNFEGPKCIDVEIGGPP